jgi:hypothetical protein
MPLLMLAESGDYKKPPQVLLCYKVTHGVIGQFSSIVPVY